MWWALTRMIVPSSIEAPIAHETIELNCDVGGCGFRQCAIDTSLLFLKKISVPSLAFS